MNVFNSFLMAYSAVYSNFNVDAGVGFSGSWISCDAEISAVFTAEVLGMSKFRGKNYTVSELLSDLVFFM